MGKDLVHQPSAELSTELADLVRKAEDLAAKARSENTRRAYRSDWKKFAGWCEGHGLEAMPASPMTVIAFLSDMAPGHTASTIERYTATITKAHKVAGHPSPLSDPGVQEVLSGIRKTRGMLPAQKRAAVLPILRKMCATCPQDTLRGVRDRAVLLVGWAGAFRRSEIVLIRVEDLKFVDEGVMVAVPRSKTDQEGRGQVVAIPYGSDPRTCPVRTLKRWLELSAITTGPVFRPILRGKPSRARSPEKDGGKLISRIVKRAARRAGLDPAAFGGHSLRSGLATQAADAGKPDRSIMRHGRWRDRRTLDKYVREAKAWKDNAAQGIGL